jgi:preprotein translocase subunit SecB
MSKEDTKAVDSAASDAKNPEFAIQRIYVKDLSFEAPLAPAIFQQEWKPQLDLQIQTNSSKLSEGIYEVVLKVVVTAKSGDKTAFVVELQQAGIFTVHHFPEEQMQHVLNSACASLLFPYAREVISDMAMRGTFPPLYLAPINFDALFAQHLEQQKSGAAAPVEKEEESRIIH